MRQGYVITIEKSLILRIKEKPVTEEQQQIASSEKIFKRDFFLITGANFCSSLMFNLMIVVITGYAASAFNTGTSAGSLAASIYIIGALVGRLIIGPKIDEWGARCTMIIGFLVNFAVAMLFFLPLSWIAFLLLRFVQGVSFAFMGSSCNAGVVFLLPEKRQAEGMSYYSLSMVLGSAFGPFLAAQAISSSMGYSLVFYILCAVAIAAVAMAVALRLPPVPKVSAKQKTADDAPKGLSSVICPVVVPSSVVVLIFMFGYGALLSHLLIYAEGKDLVEAAGIFFLVYAGATFVCRLFSGRLVDSKGYAVVLVPALAFAALGFFVLSWANTGFVLLVAAVCMGVGIGTCQATFLAMVPALAPKEDMGKAMSTYFIAVDGGSGIGPLAAGFAAPYLGYEMTFAVMGALCLGALVLYVVLRRAGKAL